MADPISTLTQILAQFAQNVGEQSAHLRAMGDSASNSINGYYREAKRYLRAFDEGRGLRYRPATIQLSAAITGAGTGAAGSNFFRVAQNEDFLVQSIRGFILLNSLVTEPNMTIAGGFPVAVNLTPKQIAEAKALNCSFQLQNRDTKVPLTENLPLSLASITPEVGGEIMAFGPNIVPGFVIPHNMTIEALFALQSANAFFNTASTTYGIAMTGLYVSREVR